MRERLEDGGMYKALGVFDVSRGTTAGWWLTTLTHYNWDPVG